MEFKSVAERDSFVAKTHNEFYLSFRGNPTEYHRKAREHVEKHLHLYAAVKSEQEYEEAKLKLNGQAKPEQTKPGQVGLQVKLKEERRGTYGRIRPFQTASDVAAEVIYKANIAVAKTSKVIGKTSDLVDKLKRSARK